MKRDAMHGLKCQVPGCKTTIRAFTGHDELMKLIRHMRSAHLARLTLQEALELRAAWEERAKNAQDS